MDITQLVVAVTIAILSVLLGVYASHKLWTHRFSHGVGTRVFGPNEMKREKPDGFYQVMAKTIAQATSEVVYFGEGFIASEAQGLPKAKNFIEDTRVALNKDKNFQVIRMQTVNPHDEKWCELLKEIGDEFPSQFHLYMIDNLLDDHIQSITLIDPKEEYSTVFYLTCAETSEGADENTALTGAMITGSKELTLALATRLGKLRKKYGTKA